MDRRRLTWRVHVALIAVLVSTTCPGARTQRGAKPQFASLPISDWLRVSTNNCLDFICSVSGTPQPNVTYSFNGRPLNISNEMYISLSDGSLRICNINPDRHAGAYRCTAKNIHGTAWRQITIGANYIRHTVPIIRTAPQVTSLTQQLTRPPGRGQCIRLTCLTSGTQPIQIRWTKDGFPIEIFPGTSQPSPQVLNICNLSPGLHSGTYRCQAQNDYGSSYRDRRVFLRAEEAASISIASVFHRLAGLPSEQCFEFTCVIISTRPANMRWYFNRLPVSRQSLPHSSRLPDGRLRVCLLNERSHAGYYWCEAHDAFSGIRVYRNQTLTSQEIRQVTRTQFRPVISEMIFSVNDARTCLLVTCHTKASPPAQIIYQINNQPATNSPDRSVLSNGTLGVCNVDLERDTGVYRCFAINGLGNDFHRRTLLRSDPVLQLLVNIATPGPTPCPADEARNEQLRAELQQLQSRVNDAEKRYREMEAAMATLEVQAAATQRRYDNVQRMIAPVRTRNTFLLQEKSEVDSKLKQCNETITTIERVLGSCPAA